MKRRIKASNSLITAAAETESKLQDTISNLKDDFDYLISGLEKLERAGAGPANDALIIAEQFADELNTVVSEIANKLVG